MLCTPVTVGLTSWVDDSTETQAILVALDIVFCLIQCHLYNQVMNGLQILRTGWRHLCFMEAESLKSLASQEATLTLSLPHTDKTTWPPSTAWYISNSKHLWKPVAKCIVLGHCVIPWRWVFHALIITDMLSWHTCHSVKERNVDQFLILSCLLLFWPRVLCESVVAEDQEIENRAGRRTRETVIVGKIHAQSSRHTSYQWTRRSTYLRYRRLDISF